MSPFSKFVTGLIALWGVAVAARYVQGDAIAADLQTRAGAALKEKDFGNVNVAFNSEQFGFRRVAVLSGENATAETVAEAKKSVGGLTGIHKAIWQGGETLLPEEKVAEAAPVAEVPAKEEAPVEPYRWQAVHQEEDKVVLRGMVPSEAYRTVLMDKAADLFPKKTIIDEMTIRSEGVPEGKWLKAARSALKSLATFDTGIAELDNTSLMVRGVTGKKEIADGSETSLDDMLPKGFEGRIEVELKEIPVAEEEKAPAVEEKKEEPAPAPTEEQKAEAAKCQDEITSLLKGKTIQFDTAKATLRNEKDALLDKLADIAKACEDAHITVEGHTDPQGAASKNLTLSQQRAETVVNYLVSAGIDGDRLKAVGFGETRLLDKRETAEAYQRNRRIEFRVKAVGTE